MTRRQRTGPGKQWSCGDRVFLYIRVSKIGDRSDTLISDVVQEEVCRKWADQQGLVVMGDPVSDLDRSGRDVTKRQINATIERVRRGEADGILVWKISRWGRNVLDSMLNVAALQAVGGFIASATENLDDIETPMGRFSLTQMLAIAQLQSDQIGETWRNIQDHRVARGLPRNGRDRWGYQRRPIGRDGEPADEYTIHPVQGPWLRRAYEDFVGGRTLNSIVQEMRDHQITGNGGSPMSYPGLRLIMDSGFAAGLIVDRRNVPRDKSGMPRTTNPNDCEFVPGAQPAIIDDDLWQAYVARRAETRPPRQASAAHRLAGLIRCASCGHNVKLVSHGGRCSRDYVCVYTPGNLSVTIACPRAVRIKQDYVEQAVHDWLVEVAEGGAAYETARQHRHRAERAGADVEAMRRDITRLDDLRTRYLDQKVMSDDPDERAEMDRRRAQLKGRIVDITARLRRAEQEAASANMVAEIGAFDALLGLWDHGDVQLLNGMLCKIVRTVYVHPAIDPVTGERRTGTNRVEIVPLWESDPGCGPG